jgi:hypothetical protein
MRNRRSSRRNQKVYKMKGCSKKTRKNYLGGSSDAPLAYTGKQIPSQTNPFLAYTGNGGSSCGLSTNTNLPTNTNALNPAYPNSGPVPNSNTVYNSSAPQRGGSCSACSAPIMTGGGCGCGLPSMMGGSGALTSMGFMVGGVKHRTGCKCLKCKQMRNSNKSGGNCGIPYPDGLVGSPWTPSIGGWPGVNGVPGDSNYIPPNQYNVDLQTQMVNHVPVAPYTKGGKRRRQKGGTLSNFLSQDLINLGRQFQFGLGSAYNALAGYSAPVNPMPWKGQFPSGAPMYPVKPIV